MVDRGDLDRLHRTTQAAVRGAQDELAAFMRKAAAWPPDDLRDGLIEVMQAIVARYGDLAATAAMEWYEQARAAEVGPGGYQAVAAPAPPPAQVEGSVRAAAGHLYQGSPAMTERVLAGALQRYVTDQARGTVTANALRDPRARRFARVPRGKTCAFCMILASRGFVYTTARAAGEMNRYHDDCDCQIVPGFADDPPQIAGYDPDALYEQYTTARNQAIKDGVRDPGMSEVASRLRRQEAVRRRSIMPPKVGQWPGGVPQRLGGVRPYEDLESTPRIPETERRFDAQVGKVNPSYGAVGQWPEVWGTTKPYTINCARCSMALPLRKLGYDVQAGAGGYRPSEGGFNTAVAVSRWQRDGKPVMLEYGRTRSGNPSDKVTLTALRQMPEGSFGVIRCSWKTRGGHVWNWEVSDGQLIFWDGQIGRSVDVEQRLALAKRGTLMYARLDDAMPTDDVLDVISIPEPPKR